MRKTFGRNQRGGPGAPPPANFLGSAGCTPWSGPGQLDPELAQDGFAQADGVAVAQVLGPLRMLADRVASGISPASTCAPCTQRRIDSPRANPFLAPAHES